tara:strand:+ start:240 stop:410 length:171 start_codon:yes stop_codon:yes gene_type:complete
MLDGARAMPRGGGRLGLGLVCRLSHTERDVLVVFVVQLTQPHLVGFVISVAQRAEI